ncbi:MAG TPA: hypothetical protein VE967_06255 [Gemmatimonadaceae bacterium]|nr:hypothetical protein [Gemmatimonadaceae bacterium]
MRLAIASPIAAMGLLASPRPIVQAASAPCQVTMTDPIPIASPARVQIHFSESPGDSLSASFPDEAVVDVQQIARGPRDNELSATLVVDTQHSVAGQWQLTVGGNKQKCVGTVWIGRGR